MFCKILNLRFIHCSLYCIDLSASQFKFWYDVCHLFSNKELIKSWTLSLCHLKIVLFKLFHFLFGCWMVAYYWFYVFHYCLNSNVIRMRTSIEFYLGRLAEVIIWILFIPFTEISPLRANSFDQINTKWK